MRILAKVAIFLRYDYCTTQIWLHVRRSTSVRRDGYYVPISKYEIEVAFCL